MGGEDFPNRKELSKEGSFEGLGRGGERFKSV